MRVWFKWIGGRQGGDYAKMSLIPLWLSKLLSADAYLLKFPKGCSVGKHKDPVEEGYAHYRANFTVWNKSAGRMYILGPIKRLWRLEVFRPDLYEHGLEPVTGTMYMLSFGCKVKR